MKNLNQYDRSTAAQPFSDHVEITPDLIQYHVRRGHQLRAEAFHNGLRTGWTSLARYFRGAGVIGHVPTRGPGQRHAH